jgi:hypothetical protein
MVIANSANRSKGMMKILRVLEKVDKFEKNLLHEVPKVPPWNEEINEYESIVLETETPHTDTEAISSAEPHSTTSNNVKRNSSNVYILGFESMMFGIAAFHIWTERESIRANQLPVSVVSILVGTAFYLGYKLDKRLSVIGEIVEHKNIDQSKSHIKSNNSCSEESAAFTSLTSTIASLTREKLHLE